MEGGRAHEGEGEDVLTVILGLLVLSALVVFHELGHFWMARALGVRVDRFSIGFGPVVFSRRRHGVEWAISAFPLGGYVKMGGDDPRNREALKPGDFFAAPWWRRVCIALAGPGANFVLAVGLSIALLWLGIRVPDAPNRIGGVHAGSLADSLGFRAGDRIVEVNGVAVPTLQAVLQELDPENGPGGTARLLVEGDSGSRTVALETADLTRFFQAVEFPVPAVVGEVVIGTPAYKAGVSVGDRITAVDGEPVDNFSDLQRAIVRNPGREVVLTVFADTTGDEREGKIGIAAASVGTYTVRLGFLDGITRGAASTVATVGFMFKGIVSLFSDVSNLSQISGPVAIIQASGSAAKAGLDRLLDRAILFSVALMVFNLLPVPILDGGMVVLSVLEGARRRPMGERGLALYQGIGIAVMGTLLIFVLINDPLRIIQRQSALGRIDGP
jgi:regulator of sigma E protease